MCLQYFGISAFLPRRDFRQDFAGILNIFTMLNFFLGRNHYLWSNKVVGENCREKENEKHSQPIQSLKNIHKTVVLFSDNVFITYCMKEYHGLD